MNSKIFVTCLALVIAVTTVSAGTIGGNGQKLGKSRPMHNMTCKGESMQMKEMMAGRKDCLEQLFPALMSNLPSSNSSKNASEEDRMEAMHKLQKEIHGNQCFYVCMMKKKNILKPDGSYNADGTNTFIKSAFPDSVHSAMKTAWDECNSANGKNFSMDNKCEGYKLFHECRVKKFREICEIKDQHHKHAEESEAASKSNSSEQ